MMLTKVLRGKPYTIGSDICFPFDVVCLSSPERLVGFAQRLLARQAEVAEEVLVVGKLPQRDALPPPRGPAKPAMPSSSRCRSGIWLMNSGRRVARLDGRERGRDRMKVDIDKLQIS